MKSFKRKLGEKGQTSVEYILIIAVITVVITSVFTKLEGHLITNPDSFKNQYLGAYKNMFDGGNLNSSYKWFAVRR